MSRSVPAALETTLNLPWFVEILICVLWSALLSLQNEWSARAATLLRLGSGHFVANLNTTRQGEDEPLVLYDSHRDGGCRLVREAVSMLGLDVEIRPCPDPAEGVPSPWRDELAELAAAERAAEASNPSAPAPAPTPAKGKAKPKAASPPSDPNALPLPHLSSLSVLSIPPAEQGDGFALAQTLLSCFALDPKECFPLDLDEKPARMLCALASRVRAHVPWGRRARKVNWARLHQRRLEALQQENQEQPGHQAQQHLGQGAARSSRHGVAAPATVPEEGEDAATDGLPSPSPSPSSPSAVAAATSAAAGGSAPATPASSRSGSAASFMMVSPQASPSTPSISSPPLSPAGLPSSPSAAATAGASLLRPWSSVTQLQPLTLYAHESSAKCRPVFEILASLQLAHLVRTCAQGSLNRARLVMDYGSLFDLPTLLDPNTGRAVVGGAACVHYLIDTYYGEPGQPIPKSER